MNNLKKYILAMLALGSMQSVVIKAAHGAVTSVTPMQTIVPTPNPQLLLQEKQAFKRKCVEWTVRTAWCASKAYGLYRGPKRSFGDHIIESGIELVLYKLFIRDCCRWILSAAVENL